MNAENSTLKEISIDALVDALGELSPERFVKAEVDALLTSVKVSPASLAPHRNFLDRAYTRNLIFKNDLFEVLLLCWDKGQATPVHNHRGQLGWMIIQEGRLSVVNYRRLGCSGQCSKEKRWSMMMVDRVLTAHEGSLCHVQEGEQVHQIKNDVEHGGPAMSIHIYSRPIPSCVIYDIRRNECSDRVLQNHSEYGRIITRD